MANYKPLCTRKHYRPMKCSGDIHNFNGSDDISEVTCAGCLGRYKRVLGKAVYIRKDSSYRCTNCDLLLYKSIKNMFEDSKMEASDIESLQGEIMEEGVLRSCKGCGRNPIPELLYKENWRKDG